MFIAHIHIHNTPIVKKIHHIINVTSTKAKLFVIRCGLNQTTQLTNIEHIIFVTNSIHVAKKIFNSSIHLYQVQTLSIFKELREFFIRNHHNSIKFWNCPIQDKQLLYDIVDKETKKFNIMPIFLCKSSWDFS